jgi:glutamate 5-kinase
VAHHTPDRAYLKPHRLVIKVGTSLLTHDDGRIDRGRIGELARQIREVQTGRHVVLVSSGAIRTGMERLGLTERPTSTAKLQANAAVGQGLLMQVYHDAFYWNGMTAAQVLLTREGLASRTGYLNARAAFEALFDYDVVPIVNENDTVAVEEIHFGDNDMLAAIVASLVSADLLLILSDVRGLCAVDESSGALTDRVIPEVGEVTHDVLRHGRDSTSLAGTGGMIAKLHAAKRATRAGVEMVIAHGREEGVIARVLAGERLGTRFLASESVLPSRKQWLAFAPVAAGTIVVNSGAAERIVSGNASLLPVGVVRAEGEFVRGDLVTVADESGREIARGLTGFSADEIGRIRGRHSSEVAEVLGRAADEAIIHRDNLVVGRFEE